MRQTAYKPGFVLCRSKGMTIPLGQPLPTASRDLPGRRPGNGSLCHPYLVLLPVGLALPVPLPDLRCALTAPFQPYRPANRGWRFHFCGAIPGVTPGGCYPSPCFRGARTFLPAAHYALQRASPPQHSLAIERPSGHLTQRAYRWAGASKPNAFLCVSLVNCGSQAASFSATAACEASSR